MDDDESLYRAWADGDNRAGGRLVDRYLPAMARFFANKVADREDVQDLVGTTFELCARSLGKFRGDSKFRTYLYGIARNALRDYVKKKSRAPDRVDFLTTMIRDIGPSPSVIVGDRREHRLLLEALRSIPVAYQVVIELSFFEEMSRSEIAEILGIPQGTVATRLRKGRELLLEAMRSLTEDRRLLQSAISGLNEWAHNIRVHLDEDEGSAR